MKQQIEKIQCYKCIGGEFIIKELTISQMKKEKYFEFPIEALDDCMSSHQKIISKLENARDEYINCNKNNVLSRSFNGITDLYQDIYKKI